MSSSRSAAGSLLAFALVAAQAVGAASTGAQKPQRFGFGQPATAEQIAAWDIDVRPDGRGLPEGKGSVAQGQALYDAQCASCHGTFGESTDYMPIAGGVGTLGSDQPIRTTGSKLNHATTLWDYINRAMPFGNPKTLTANEVYALTAYVLHLNELLPADATLDRTSILRVRMPNRDGFTTDHGLRSRTGKPDTNNVACMRDCAGEPRVASEIPPHARDDHGDVSQQMRTIGPLAGGTRQAVATAPTSGATAQLARSSGCTACHGATQKIVGPSFSEIRGRYANDAGAADRLADRIRAGGSGSWGPVPMPPQPQVGEHEAKSLVKWILAGGG
jgi:cytochrome c